MCICGGVCETVAVVAVGGYIVRKLTRKRPPQKVACLKCGATEKLMYNSYYCSDCYYGILDTMDYAKGCADASDNR